MNNIIGELAGKIWKTLNEKGDLTVAKLKTALKAESFELNAAIGWLAREDKVDILKGKTTITIHLK